MTANILGTEYLIVRQIDEQNEKLKDANGLCEMYAHKIVLREIPDEADNFENIEAYKNKVLRHEIVHAFFAESGLRSNSDYAENEELVDWIAIQGQKIYKAWEQAGCLD